MMQTSKYVKHEPLLQWMIGMSILLFALLVIWQQGLIQMVISGDRSRLSLVILISFVLINVHVVSRVISISLERNAVNALRQLLLKGGGDSLSVQDNTVKCHQHMITDSLIAQHVLNLARRLSIEQPGQELSKVQTHLLAAMDKRVRGSLKYGWMFADLMIKLGLIGTVIGFVYMLGSVATLEHYDVSLMQDLLRNMSGGMRVALFTTLSGLLAGLLLGMQYQYLDRQSDELLAEIEELSEVFVLPALVRSTLAEQDK
ncbi:MAG: hypothetical protein EP315_02150 [Gammaproteobacteria bacterium]|nr:MAG: hypothetical protein EP315_02150 [Gammaproteobacteria bacterium]